MLKKIVALLLVFSLCLSIASSVYAAEIADFSEEALRVSDEFVAEYPGGAFSLTSVMIETHEYSGRSVIKVIRQGGSAGNMEVSVKAVDVSAKIGLDYRLSIPSLLFDKNIKGDETTATILENGQTEVESVSESVSGAAIELGSSGMEGVEEQATGKVFDSANESVSGAAIELGSSGLRGVKEQSTGKVSDREKLAVPDEEEMEQLNMAAAAASDYYASASGTEFTFSFADGERVKSFNLDIINDSTPEAQEQIVFVITSVTGGGFVGLQKETTVNIIDDEPYEVPAMGFSTSSFTAGSESAKVTVKRTSGVNYYAGARISTVGDSAKAGTDYTELGQKILFIPGQTELSLEIPIVKNESGIDKYFYVKLEPDKGCTVSGDETALVLIPREEKEIPKANSSLLLMSSASEDGVATLTGSTGESVTLGTKTETHNNDFNVFGSNGIGHGYNNGGWYEVLLQHDNQYGNAFVKDKHYLSTLESIIPTIELYDLKHHRKNDVLVYGYVDNKSKKLLYADDDANKKKILTLYNRKDDGHPSSIYSGLVDIYFHVQNGEKDYAAMRIYSVDINYRYFEFAVQPAIKTSENTFDFSKPGNCTPSTPASAGEIEITTADGKPVKGFYTSQDYEFKVETKNMKPGYHLTGIKFYKNMTESDYTYDITKTPGKLTIDHNWLYKYAKNCIQVDGINKLYIQPIFERDKASITVSINEKDKDEDKGEIAGVKYGKKYEIIKTTNYGEVNLYTGDQVKLTGFGYNDYTVSGYEVTLGDGKKSEAGEQNAGIYTAVLTGDISIEPIFGAKQLNIKRDPADKKNIQGTITYGGQSTEDGIKLNNIKSGQVVDFVSIPPEGYLTMWKNRTGDIDGDGVLELNEYIDPETNKLYRQYDYNGDDVLDSEYGPAVYGDLFSYKINQPNPLFYYSYDPLKDRTLYSGPVSGRVTTREYDIRHGFTQAENDDGAKFDKYVPVIGAAVKMGGNYDRSKNSDAQIGYGSSTNSYGLFTFNAIGVLRDMSYIFGMDYNGASFIDTICTTGINDYKLPTFTSMMPVSINAYPEGGEDVSTVSGSVVMLKDKTVDFVLKTASLESNVKIDKVNFKIYSKNGTLLSEKIVANTEGNTAVFSANLNHTFTPNANLTVQLIDQNGNESREYNAGFQFRPPMKATSLLPQFIAKDINSVTDVPVVKEVPIIGSLMGALDMGLSKYTDMTVNDEGYTIYLGAGHEFDKMEKELINTIDKAKGTDKAAADKAKDEMVKKNENAPEKADSNVKVKSTIANDLSIKASLEMNIKYDPDADMDKVASPYYFGHLKLLVTMTDKFTSVTTVVLPIGLSVVLTLDVGGSVTGFIYIKPATVLGGVDPIKVYADQFGNYPYTDTNKNDPKHYKFDAQGGIILEPFIELSVSGQYGVAEVKVDGKAVFNLIFTTDHQDRGTVTLNASVEVTVLGFEVYGHEFEDWSTSLFDTTSKLMSTMLDSEGLNDKKFEPISRDYLDNRSSWLGATSKLQSVGGGSAYVADFTENTLMSGIYPYPDSQLMRIDEDSLLMVFVDDHEGRSERNRAAIYYCVSHDNGTTFSQPILLSDDGTLDSNPRLVDLGDRILCMYSSMDSLIMDEMNMEEILEANGLEMAFFNKNKLEFSQPKEVTKYTARENPVNKSQLLGDYYSDENGNAVYDETTGQVLIMYTKSDYTSDTDRELKVEDLFGNYSTIAYMIYDTKTDSFLPYDESDYPAGMTAEEKTLWNTDWYGQHFLDAEIVDDSLPGGKLSDPLVLDLTTAIKEGKAYFTYTVDMDGNMETLDDREIYLQTYDFAGKTFSKPFKISDLQEGEAAKSDGKPQLVLYNGEMFLFYNADTAIHYYNLDRLFTDLKEGQTSLSPRIAFEYREENLPTDDYKVLVGDDGKLYLVWTEKTVRLEEGVEKGTQASLKTKNYYHENQIYASVFYQDFSKNWDEVTEDYYDIDGIYGRWSNRVQITEGPGSYSDISASVMADGKTIITAKKSEKVLLDDTETSPRVDDPNTIQLVALTLTPVAQAEMNQDAITFEPANPVTGELVNIVAEIGNHGLMPLLDATVDFYAVEGITETFIGTANSVEPVYGGMESALSIEWNTPENLQDIKIIAKLRDGDGVAVTAQAEKAFPHSTILQYGLFDVQYVTQNYFKAYIEVHTRNKSISGAELVINRIDSENNRHELKRVSVDDKMVVNKMFVINETFEMLNKDLVQEAGLMGGSADIEVRIEKDGQLLAKQTGNVVKDVSWLYKDIINKVSGVSMSKTNLTMSKGDKSTITAGIYPAEAVQNNRIVYVSSNPEVATVNATGEITVLKNGNAVITAYAVPDAEVSIQTLDGYSVDGNVLDELALEDCKSGVVNITAKSDESSSEGNNNPSGTEQVNTPSIKTTYSADGSITITITTEALTNNSGKASATVTDTQINEAIGKALEESSKQRQTTGADIEIQVKAPAASKTVETSISAAALKEIVNRGIKALTFSSPVTNITFDEKSLTDIANQATEDVKITASKVDVSIISDHVRQIVGDRPVFDFSVISGDSKISKFSGNVSLSVPYTPGENEDINAIVIYYINDVGELEIVCNCAYNQEDGTVTFKTNHFSQYAVGYNKVTFKDVQEGVWYEDAVSFIAARGISAGTGDGNYSHADELTRGQFVTMLMRTYGIAPDQNPTGNFSDAGNTYYTGYLAAAKRLGISSGTGNNMFSPDNAITRQEMFTLLYNALKVIDELPVGIAGKALTDFSDAEQIESWAKDEVALLVKAGIVSGSNGRLNPTARVDRAQMAQVLYNLLKKQ